MQEHYEFDNEVFTIKAVKGFVTIHMKQSGINWILTDNEASILAQQLLAGVNHNHEGLPHGSTK